MLTDLVTHLNYMILDRIYNMTIKSPSHDMYYINDIRNGITNSITI